MQKIIIEDLYQSQDDRKMDLQEYHQLETTLIAPGNHSAAVDFIRCYTRTIELLAPDSSQTQGEDPTPGDVGEQGGSKEDVQEAGRKVNGGGDMHLAVAEEEGVQDGEKLLSRRMKKEFALDRVNRSLIRRMKRISSLSNAISYFRNKYNDPMTSLGLLLTTHTEILEYWQLSPEFRFGHPVTLKRRLHQMSIPVKDVCSILSRYWK